LEKAGELVEEAGEKRSRQKNSLAIAFLSPSRHWKDRTRDHRGDAAFLLQEGGSLKFLTMSICDRGIEV